MFIYTHGGLFKDYNLQIGNHINFTFNRNFHVKYGIKIQVNEYLSLNPCNEIRTSRVTRDRNDASKKAPFLCAQPTTLTANIFSRSSSPRLWQPHSAEETGWVLAAPRTLTHSLSHPAHTETTKII
jgi:hypothetical protein